MPADRKLHRLYFTIPYLGYKLNTTYGIPINSIDNE